MPRYANMWKVVIGTAAFTIPASVTLFDLCGYVAKVEGSSMQVWRADLLVLLQSYDSLPLPSYLSVTIDFQLYTVLC